MTALATAQSRTTWDESDSGYVGRTCDDEGALTVGSDLRKILESLEETLSHQLTAASWQTETVAQSFTRLAQEWRSAVAFVSSVTEMVAHPKYAQIIGLGKEALPILLQDLANKPDHWFPALKAITAVDPVPPGDRGDIGKMADAWVRWGVEQGHIAR